MDTDQRQLAVTARMAELKAIHLPLTRPCSECRFGPLDGSGRGICEHYANWQIVGDPATGKRAGSVWVSTMTARSVEGLCGPEGLLFEGRNRVQRVARWVRNLDDWWSYWLGLAVFIGVPFGLLIAGSILWRAFTE